MLEFIEVLENEPNKAYDYISNNAHNMSKEELKDIIKELLYAIHTNTDETEHDKILNDASVELAENYKD